MNKSGLHDKLRTFPKNHKLSEESIEIISTSIDNEICIRRMKSKRETYLNKRMIAAGLLSLTLLTILFWSLDGQETKILQEYAGNPWNAGSKNAEENVRSQEAMNSKDIYGTFEGQNSWAFDPREPENLFIEGASIVQIKVLSIDEAKILPKTETFYTDMPYTPIEVTIGENIDGNPLSGEKTIYVEGGDLRISNLMEFWDKNRVSEMGLNKLTKEEQESKLISFTSEYDYEMESGKEYAVILVKQLTKEDIYTVMARGYGVFEIDKTDKGEKTYRNVITGKTSNLKFSDSE